MEWCLLIENEQENIEKGRKRSGQLDSHSLELQRRQIHIQDYKGGG